MVDSILVAEMLVVSDGDNDDTSAVAKSYVCSCSRYYPTETQTDLETKNRTEPGSFELE